MVDGHELHEEDLRLMYTFDQSSDSAAQYEAHSDAQVRSAQSKHRVVPIRYVYFRISTFKFNTTVIIVNPQETRNKNK